MEEDELVVVDDELKLEDELDAIDDELDREEELDAIDEELDLEDELEATEDDELITSQAPISFQNLVLVGAFPLQEFDPCLLH